AETECPAAAVCRAPAVMPFCQEEEEACEMLPMPAVEMEDEEQEAPQTDVTCPNAGRPSRSCPVPAQPSCKPTGGEEPGDGEEQSNCKAARKKLERIKARQVIDDWHRATHPIFPNVDTMEMRPCDRQLYDYSPGPL